MTRKKIICRTLGFFINGYTVVFPIFIVQLFELFKFLTGEADSEDFKLFLFLTTVELSIALFYRKYLLDIFLKSTSAYTGKVVKITPLGGSNAQAYSKAKRYELIGTNGEENVRLIILLSTIEKIHQVNLLQKAENLPVHISYLSRSKCVVDLEII